MTSFAQTSCIYVSSWPAQSAEINDLDSPDLSEARSDHQIKSNQIKSNQIKSNHKNSLKLV